MKSLKVNLKWLKISALINISLSKNATREKKTAGKLTSIDVFTHAFTIIWETANTDSVATFLTL